MELTKVYDLSTGNVYAEFSLPAKQAVISAWFNYHKSMNTWTHAQIIESEVYPLTQRKYGWTIGKFWAEFSDIDNMKGGDM